MTFEFSKSTFLALFNKICSFNLTISSFFLQCMSFQEKKSLFASACSTFQVLVSSHFLKSLNMPEKAVFLLKIVLYREIALFSTILKSYYTGDRTKWIHNKRGPPVQVLSSSEKFLSLSYLKAKTEQTL